LEEAHFKLLLITTPLHVLTSVKNTFQWEGKKEKSFNTLKEKISTTPVLALSNLQQLFEIETDANGYAMGVVLMQYCKPICYHSKKFNQVVVNYPIYDKELYALVQSVNKWKHYLLGKETIQITNPYSISKHKPNCNNLGTIDGWVFYNNLIW
jgi:hypothetical protein